MEHTGRRIAAGSDIAAASDALRVLLIATSRRFGIVQRHHRSVAGCAREGGFVGLSSGCAAPARRTAPPPTGRGFRHGPGWHRPLRAGTRRSGLPCRGSRPAPTPTVACFPVSVWKVASPVPDPPNIADSEAVNSGGSAVNDHACGSCGPGAGPDAAMTGIGASSPVLLRRAARRRRFCAGHA